MLTRCPGCQTVFRLTSEQLLARQGRVRCGSCLHPFNALDHLAESDPKAGQQSNRPQQRPTARTSKTPATPKPAATASSPSAATVIPETKPGESLVQPASAPKTSPKAKPVLAPLIKKASQRSLSELDFSSSIDTHSKVPRPTPQWTASQDFPPLDQSFEETLISPAPIQTPSALPVGTVPEVPTPTPVSQPTPKAPTPQPTPKVPTPIPVPTPQPVPEAPTPVPTPQPAPEVATPAPTPQPVPEAATPAPTPEPVPEAATPAPTPTSSPEATPHTEASLPPQDEPLPQITRSRESQERKRNKPQEKSPDRQRKRVKPAKPSRLASTLHTIGKALEEHRTKWGKRRKRATVAQNETVDNEVLSEIFSKFGIETKIDKIEAEFDAEAKAARTAARSKSDTPKSSDLPEKSPPSHFDVYGNLDVHAQHHKLWTTAVSVLGIILVIQSIFLFRHAFARWIPATRPALVALCNTFGCAMPLPRDKSQIMVEKNDQGFARRGDTNHYVFYARVINNANFAQDWPNLELTLKNMIHQPLSSRILTPAEWVPPEIFAQNVSMAPQSEVNVNVELEVTGPVPEKYEVRHFYP